MPRRFTARFDPLLRATMLGRERLFYSAGADPSVDRPAHVRAASGLSWLGGRLCVLQDDANFIARVDLAGGAVEPFQLPAGPGGQRLFDEGRGNKELKLDLEACVTASVDGDEVLVALGSGSSAARERIAVVRASEVRLVDASSFYAALREDTDFAGSELNIEGAALLPDGRLRLFQRGNGARRGSLEPVDATADLSWPALWAYLASEGRAPVPELRDVVQYDLGQIRGVRLTFTDATVTPDGRIFFLAAAEDSPDAVRDGDVVGAALGICEGDGARWTHLVDEDGRPLPVKAEGLALDPDNPGRAYVAVDPDDPDLPTELWEVALSGAWR